MRVFVLIGLMSSVYAACASAPDSRDAELAALREELAVLRRQVERAPQPIDPSAPIVSGDPRTAPLGICPVGTTPYDEEKDRQERGCRDAQGRRTGPWEALERGERIALGAYQADVPVGTWWGWRREHQAFELETQGTYEGGVKVGPWRESCNVELPQVTLEGLEDRPRPWHERGGLVELSTTSVFLRMVLEASTPSQRAQLAPIRVEVALPGRAGIRCEGGYLDGRREGPWRFGDDATFALPFADGHIDGEVDVRTPETTIRGRFARGTPIGPLVWTFLGWRSETSFADGKPDGLWVAGHVDDRDKFIERHEARFEAGALAALRWVGPEVTWTVGVKGGVFHGPVVAERDGQRTVSGAFAQGKPSGTWRYRDGERTRLEIRYGKTTELNLFGDDGKPFATGAFDAENRPTGRWRVINGGELKALCPVSEGAYVEGQEEGPWKGCVELPERFYPGTVYCGQLSYEGGVLDGPIAVKDDTHSIEATYRKGKPHGVVIVRDATSVIRKLVVDGTSIDRTDYVDGNPREHILCGPPSGADDGQCIIAEAWNERGVRIAFAEPDPKTKSFRIRRWDDQGALLEDAERDRSNEAPIGKFYRRIGDYEMRGQLVRVVREDHPDAPMNQGGAVPHGRWTITTEGRRIEGSLAYGVQVGRWRELDPAGREVATATYDERGERLSGPDTLDWSDRFAHDVD